MSPVGQTQFRDALQLQLVESEGTLASLRTKKVVLQKQRKEAKTLMTEFNNSSTELATLLRDKEKYEISYRKYAESSEQARIDEALKLEKISNISIAQAPTRPIQADKSKRKIILLGGLVGGLIAAIGMAYLLENMDDTLKRPEDIKKKLSIPVIASVPCFGATGEQKKQDIFNIANLDVLPKPSKSDGACAGNEQAHVYCEELICQLFSKEDSSLGKPPVVAITSSRAGEGVSTIATFLATNLTRRGRVLMVDMDAFKKQGGSSENLPYKDLSNVLALNIEFQSRGKSILPANAEAFGNNGFEIVDEIQGIRNKAYDFIILSLPSVLDDSSTSMLARLANQVILVIEAERVRWQVLKNVCEKLTVAGVVIKGAILNKRKYYIPTWLYRKL
jgi:Mrp family chromosome partitioning ATPase